MSDDASMETSDGMQDNAQAAQDSVNELIGERTDAEAVFYYGVYSLSFGVAATILYVLFNDNLEMFARYSDGIKAHIAAYIPAGVAWMMLSFFDGQFMRTVFGDIVSASVFGPFFAHWYAFGQFVLDNDGDYASIEFILGAVIWFALTIFEELVQIILLPQVFEWVENAPLMENASEMEDDE